MTEALVRSLVEAIVRSIDEDKLRRELARATGVEGAAPTPAALPPSGDRADGNAKPSDVLDKIVMADILDDAILGARAGDKGFPLRLFFGQLGGGLAGEVAFTLASGLNFYFRADMDEEPKMRLGLEVSRLYYRFAEEAGQGAAARAQTSPLLATLMSGGLARLRFESVDHATVFDSAVHEREEGSSASSASIARPASFLCRVPATGVVRAKARVRT